MRGFVEYCTIKLENSHQFTADVQYWLKITGEGSEAGNRVHFIFSFFIR